jgi:hypothetical protein
MLDIILKNGLYEALGLQTLEHVIRLAKRR